MADITLRVQQAKSNVSLMVASAKASATVQIAGGIPGPMGPQGPAGEGTLGYYGAFSDYTDQSVASATTPTVMKFGTTDYSNGVSVVSPANTRIKVGQAATYNLQWSGQFENADNVDQDVQVWVRKNGSDVIGSTGYVSIPARKNVGNPGHTISGWNFLFELVANDYLELVWQADSTLVTIQTYSAATTPFVKPSTASLVATLTQVTNKGPQGDPGVIVQATAPTNTSLLWVDTTS